jgi:hypothetical protein
MRENIFFAALFFPCTAAVLIFAMKYFAGIMEAKAKFAQEQAYRDLAASVADAQAANAKALSSNHSALTEIQARLITLEKILKEVE